MSQSSSPPIKFFKIKKLHGDRTIEVDFTDSIRIILASNGTGKTSLISILYHFLSGNFYRLSQFDFEEIEVTFSDGTEFAITQQDLETQLSFSNRDSLPISARRLIDRVDPDRLNELFELYRRFPNAEALRRSAAFQKIRSETGMMSSEIFKSLTLISRFSHEPSLFSSDQSTRLQALIKKYLPYDLLFLPTYRRVEEDLSNLGLSAEDVPPGAQLINFGMSDVKEEFERVIREISNSSLVSYQQMSGRMLDELMRGLSTEALSYERLGSAEEVERLLKRISSTVSPTTQQQILALVESGRIREQNYRPLAYFLSRLVDINDERQKAETVVIQFTNVVNSYLEDKAVVYDSDAMSLSIKGRRNGKDIALERLSSGEKKLVSLFSQIYLSKHKMLAVLFDEPEISLSIDWQPRLLPDIMKSGKCGFLLAATHSPFIFDNDFQQYALPVNIEY
jgi:ABC-type transport system involved in cytochrome c biogenesis ATPase subunit